MPALENAEDFVSREIDYVIVGGGTTGLTVAARLTEDPSFVVGVLEAGDYHEHDPTVNIPGFGIDNPKLDWCFRTVPQQHANNRVLAQSRGKGIGGSSALNFVTIMRPAKRELDCWEELGNAGWNWDSLFPYMKKSECLDPVTLTEAQRIRFAADPNPDNHGFDGPIHYSFPPQSSDLVDRILESCETHGLPRNPDAYGGRPNGGFLGFSNINSSNSTRSYAAPGYYAPNISRPNFLALTGAHATKVILQPTGDGLQRAIGVSFTKGGKSYTVRAKKEVILSAGAFQSPQLLELSGIGNRDVLEPLGIHSIVDLPGVGENLQDHGLIASVVEVDPAYETMEILEDPIQLAQHQELYKQNKGLLAAMPASFFAFLPASTLADPETVHNWASSSTIDLSPKEVFASVRPEVKKGIERGYEIMRTFVDDPDVPTAQFIQPNRHFWMEGIDIDNRKRYISLMSVYSHPFSRGSVHIASSDPQAPPSIQPNYFSNPTDLDILTKVLRFAQKLFDTSPFKEKIVKKVVPTGKETDEELREHVRKYFTTVYHTVGTCAMMPKDLGGVVDSELKVYGTENLRVIDISIAPLEVSSNTQTLAYAIGEKASDIIKGSVSV